MLDNCVTSTIYNSNSIYIDTCENVLNFDTRNLDAFTLVDMSNHCFELYKFRLGNEEESNYQIGFMEYSTIYRTLIQKIVSFKPTNLSFSISSTGPSLHFIVRLPNNVSVFLETYIDDSNDDNTYLQVLVDEDPLLQVNDGFENCMNSLDDKLEEIFPNVDKIFVNL
jgi:hypothetical protein